MKTYQGVRALVDIKADIESREGWNLDTTKHDCGADWVTIYGEWAGYWAEVIFCPFNGRFIMRDPHDNLISESDDHLDELDWYTAVLDFLYIPAAD